MKDLSQFDAVGIGASQEAQPELPGCPVSPGVPASDRPRDTSKVRSDGSNASKAAEIFLDNSGECSEEDLQAGVGTNRSSYQSSYRSSTSNARSSYASQQPSNESSAYKIQVSQVKSGQSTPKKTILSSMIRQATKLSVFKVQTNQSLLGAAINKIRSSATNVSSGNGSAATSIFSSGSLRLTELRRKRQKERQSLHGTAAAMVSSPRFEVFMALVIISHTAFMAADIEFDSTKRQLFLTADYCFLCIYIFEVLLRLYVSRQYFIYSYWNVFDTVCALLGIIAVALSGSLSNVAAVRIIRLARLARVVRVLVVIRPLHLLVETIVTSFSTILWSALLLGIVLMVASLCAMEVIRPEVEVAVSQGFFRPQDEQHVMDAFSNIHHSFSTLFGFVALQSWDDIMEPIMQTLPWTTPIFISFSIVTTFGILNLLAACIIETVLEFAKEDQERNYGMKNRKDILKQHLIERFEALDTDDLGIIKYSDVMQEDGEIHDLLIELLDTSTENLELMWSMIDVENEGAVPFKTLLDMLIEVNSEETTWTILRMYSEQQRAMSRIEEMNRVAHQAINSNRSMRGSLLSLNSSSTACSDVSHLSRVSFSAGSQRSMSRIPSFLQSSDAAPLDVSARSSMASNISVDSRLSVISSQSRLSSCNFDAQPNIQPLRGVPMEQVATTSHTALEFWQGRLSSEKELQMSEPCKTCDFFVSHSWVQPGDWYDHFRRRGNELTENFVYLKATDFNSIYIGKKKTMKSKEQEKLLCWIDRVCQPRQAFPGNAAQQTVEAIENAQQRCRGMIVLLSWNYFLELQCIFEWVHFLAWHPKLTDVDIAWDSSLRQNPHETLHLFLAAVENINVERAECRLPEARTAFEDRLCKHFSGQDRSDSFRKAEHFAKAMAIALMARSLLLLRARGKDGQDWLAPLVQSADRMELHPIARIIDRAAPQMWFNTMFQGDVAQYVKYIHHWFQEELVLPILNQERQTAVRRDADKPGARASGRFKAAATVSQVAKRGSFLAVPNRKASVVSSTSASPTS